MDVAFLSLLGGGALFLGREISKRLFAEPLSQKIRVWAHQKIIPKGTIAPKEIHTRIDLAYQLFLSSKALRTDCIPPTAWSHKPPDVELPSGGKTYGHEAAVLESILSFVQQGNIDIQVKDDFWVANTGSSRIILASGGPNVATREIIGTPETPGFCPKLSAFPVKLAYAIGMGEGPIKRMQYGELIERRALSVHKATGRERLQAETDAGRQKTDYLLVTRVPGRTKGTVYTVLAGLHGPGTRSAELLFSSVPPKDLEDLASRIGHRPGQVPFFQAVFRASQFRTIDGSDVPSQMELVTERFPPIRIRG